MRQVDILAQREAARLDDNVRMRVVDVTDWSANTATVTIRLGGTTLSGVSYVGTGDNPPGYGPAVAFQTGEQIIVLGMIARVSNPQ